MLAHLTLDRFVNRYDWIALLDVDEVIVPRKHNSWAEMMDEVVFQEQGPFPFVFQEHLDLNPTTMY